MSTNDVSDTVITLLDNGRIKWPKGISDRNQFIIENLGKVWNALEDINIYANTDIFSNLETKNSCVSHAEEISSRAWASLSSILMLVLTLEDSLGIEISPSVKYGSPGDFSNQKARIRERLKA